MQVVNPAGAALPTQTPDSRLPVAGNSQFVGEPRSCNIALTQPPLYWRSRLIGQGWRKWSITIPTRPIGWWLDDVNTTS